MRCDDARQLIQEQLDELLLPLDRAALAAHLQHCEACAHERRKLAAVVASLQRLPEAAHVPHNFTSSVMAALPEMLPAQEGRGHLVRWGLAAAAAVLAFVLGLAMLPHAGGPDVARETLAPLSASLRLDGALAAEAVETLARLLDAAAAELAATSLTAKLAFVMTLAAACGALAFLVQGGRHLVADGIAIAPRGRRG